MTSSRSCGRSQDGLPAQGLDVVAAPICCVRSEFDNAISAFNQQEWTRSSRCTWPTRRRWNRSTPWPRRRLPAHRAGHDDGRRLRPGRGPGAHHVQPRHPRRAGHVHHAARRGEPFQIVAGHVAQVGRHRRGRPSLARAARAARACCANMQAVRLGARVRRHGRLRRARERTLRSALGIDVEQVAIDDLADDVRAVSDAEVAARDGARTRTATAARRPPRCTPAACAWAWACGGCSTRRALGAFSFNFQAFTSKEPPVDTVPFLEASKAMARGIGYAGEGDVLTAVARRRAGRQLPAGRPSPRSSARTGAATRCSSRTWAR